MTEEHPGVTGDKSKKRGRCEFLRRDDITGSDSTVYLRRWIIFACPLFSIRLHKFLRSDQDVLHDHPWSFVSLILKGGYYENRYRHDLEPLEAVCHCGDYVRDHWQGGSCGSPSIMEEVVSTWHGPGSILFRRAECRHQVQLATMPGGCIDIEPSQINKVGLVRVELNAPVIPCWTLVLTGPARRSWGFWCPKGWVPWREFLGKLKGICS